MTTQTWQRNLYLLWTAQFVLLMGTSMVIPFLPLYVEQLGVHALSRVELWSGAIFSVSFLLAALVSPLWGHLADRRGRKIMVVRSGLALALANALMAAATSPLELLLLRAFLGLFAGFLPAAVALVASAAPRERLGWALGILQTGAVAGSVSGPLLGGVLADTVGLRSVFLITAGLCLAASLLVVWQVREHFHPAPPARRARHGFASPLRQPALRAMFLVFFTSQFAVMSAEPIIAVYVRTMYHDPRLLASVAGAVFAMVGVGNVLASPFLGRRSDRLGYRRVLLISLAGAALFYLPQALAAGPFQLGAMRLFAGAFVGGIIPTANALVGRFSLEGQQGGSYGLTSSAFFLGNVVGPLAGAGIAASWGIRWVFPVTSLLLLANAWWVWHAVREPVAASDTAHP
ncbi:MAG: MFS transporter [Thermaerobacter sp.]|nr:MFS transporter [Thermaerobacter sp.]